MVLHPRSTHCSNISNIFKTLVRLLSKTTVKLEAWLPKECVMETRWGTFKTAGQGKLGWIISSQKFYRKRKILDTEAAAWPGYISHYLIKLKSISTTDFITFLSDKDGGRASYKFFCGDSGFIDCLDRYDEVMADRVFQITQELLLKYFALNVLPGARIKSQMANSEVRKPKTILN